MERFNKFTSRLVPLPIDNIDTDQIIPARFLKTVSKAGLAEQLFYDWRYDAAGKPIPDFILNRPQGQAGRVLLAGDNFGCGSSREHAPWALKQYGFKAVISTSFADIFRGNSLKNSLLPLVVSPEVHDALFAAVQADPSAELTVDLAQQTLTMPNGSSITFPMDEFAKYCMLEGVDELGYILQQQAQIADFESKRESTINTLAPV
jgi:3-isopropylmalate/(R)-2-methylmalate dehydratase small subunit